MWVVVYKTYGQWKCTSVGFETEKQAFDFIHHYHAEKDYITDSTPRYVELP